MKVICRHCQQPCKRIGLVTCDKYSPKANRPKQLETEIKEAYLIGDHIRAKKLQEELFRINHG